MRSRALRHRALWRLLAATFLGLVALLSLVPSPPELPGALGWDKLQHTVAYGFLAWWFLQAWEGRRALAWCALLVAVGGLVELLQGLTSLRQPSLLDALANALGVALGAWLWRGPLGGVLASLDARLAGRP